MTNWSDLPGGYDFSHCPNPSGLCQCGCGLPTRTAPKTTNCRGVKIRKGEHYRFIVNHDKRGLRPEIIPDADEALIAWAAGVYEGEGSISGSKITPGSLHLRVAQKDPWLLERLHEIFGGTFVPLRKRGWGVVAYWELSGRRCRGFVRRIWPYLSPRRKEQILHAARGGWSPEEVQ